MAILEGDGGGEIGESFASNDALVSASVEPLMVGGFRKRTIAANREAFGDGEFSLDSDEMAGHIAIGREDRDMFGIEIGQLMSIIRTDVERATGYLVRVVAGREGKVGLTGSVRSALGLVKYEGHDGENVVGDVVRVVCVDDMLKVTKIDVEQSIGDSLSIPRKD